MNKGNLILTEEEKRFMLIMGYHKAIGGLIDATRNRDLECIDLTGRQFDVLMFLNFRKNEKISQVDIEKHFHMTNPTVTGILNRLETKGFIERLPSEKDKRVKYIRSTERAKEVFEVAERTRKHLDRVIFDGISNDEIIAMEKTMEKMFRNLAEATGNNGNLMECLRESEKR